MFVVNCLCVIRRCTNIEYQTLSETLYWIPTLLAVNVTKSYCRDSVAEGLGWVGLVVKNKMSVRV